MAGAPLQSVQQIMRHSDPKLTAVRYGHLSQDYLGTEINRLTFAVPKPTTNAPAAMAVGTDREWFGDTLGDRPSERASTGHSAAPKIEAMPVGYLVGASGVEPPTSTVSR